MAYACDICGKGKQFGHNVPFSQKKTNKVWKPNLQPYTLSDGANRMQLKLCTSCIRTLAKYRREDAAKAQVAAEKTPAKAAA